MLMLVTCVLCMYCVNAWLSSRMDYIGYISNSECNAAGDYWRGKYFCDYGYFVVGGSLYWEPMNGFGNSGANDFRVFCAPLNNWTDISNEPIPSNSPNDKGSQSGDVFCDNGQFINGFSVETGFLDCDDEGVTNIKINCQNELKDEYPVIGYTGYYNGVTTCPGESYACGQEIKYQNPLYLWPLFNDAGMTGLRILCCRYPPHTNEPTISPTLTPTLTPTLAPSLMPTIEPSAEPTRMPTQFPTNNPTITPKDPSSRIPTPTLIINEPTQSPSIISTISTTIVSKINQTITSTSVVNADSLSPTSKPTKTSQSVTIRVNFKYGIIAIIVMINIVVIILFVIYIYCWRSKKKILNKHLQSIQMNVIPTNTPVGTSNSDDILTNTQLSNNVVSNSESMDGDITTKTDAIIANEVAHNQLDIHILTKGFTDLESFETKGSNTEIQSDTIIAEHLQQNQLDIQSITKGDILSQNTPI